MLHERKELLHEINNTWEYQSTFIKWTREQQNEFLDICTGLKGPRMTYDVFFKESVNPEYAPERLGDFLSSVLGQKVKVLKTLPNDSVRITLENTLLITDIVVELEDVVVESEDVSSSWVSAEVSTSSYTPDENILTAVSVSSSSLV